MTEDLQTRFRADCSRCQALCCVAFRMEPEEGYPAPKAPGVPCRHIDRKRLNCTIWTRRETYGFHGCGTFECFGAGQFVSKVMAKRRQTWTKLDPATAERYFDDVRRLMRLHLLLAYLYSGQVEDPSLLASLEAVLAQYKKTGLMPPVDQVTHLLAAHGGNVLKIFALAGGGALRG